MKATTILIAAMATFTIAGPVVVPKEDSNTTNTTTVDTAEAAAADCVQCDNLYKACISTTQCWLASYWCSVGCQIDVCRAYNGDCKRHCDYRNC